MAKPPLSRRQRWRIDKIQQERAARSEKRESFTKEQLQGGDLGPEQPGRVIAHFGVNLEVEDAAGTRFRCQRRANLPALVTGDRVIWRPGQNNQGVIVALVPRASELCRPDSRGQLKPVAANIDQLIIVFAPLPHPHGNLIDRYLVAAAHAGVKPLLLLNKADLAETERLAGLLSAYSSVGYPLLRVSAHKDIGMPALRGRLNGRTSVFVGQSGVGKSSLINRLLPGLDLPVGALSVTTQQGTHTTTTARLLHFPSGGDLIDSPGVREFALSHVERADVEKAFIELGPLLGHCRFRDCRHQREPGCALRSAVAQGEIRAERLDSFLRLLADSGCH